VDLKTLGWAFYREATGFAQQEAAGVRAREHLF
jgi:hypothetical protein